MYTTAPPTLHLCTSAEGEGPPPESPQPRRRLWPAVVAIVLASASVVGGVAWVALRPRPGPKSPATAFLARYQAPDGRVIRLDQGGDTVSEGQAYAMLLAVGGRDRARFDRAWRWSEQHLQRSDGLLSWHWSDNRVVDPMPAADADLDAAWALSLAADRFRSTGYAAASARIAAGILANETVSAGGRPVLVAGPWATKSPYTVDPGYLAVPAMDRLATTTHDPRWAALADSSRDIIQRLTDQDGGLPPDWAGVDPSGAVWPASPPSSSSPPGFGLEAARLLVWQAAACPVADHAVVAGTHPPPGHPLLVVAQAAAASAAGDPRRAGRLLDVAARLDDAEPSYYGSAWVALGRLLLTSHDLVPCP